MEQISGLVNLHERFFLAGKSAQSDAIAQLIVSLYDYCADELMKQYKALGVTDELALEQDHLMLIIKMCKKAADKARCASKCQSTAVTSVLVSTFPGAMTDEIRNKLTEFSKSLLEFAPTTYQTRTS